MFLKFAIADLYFSKGSDTKMERIVKIHIEKLPEGYYLATSNDVQGLVAQGRTVTEALEIARDVARKLIEAQGHGRVEAGSFDEISELDYPLVVAL